MPGSAKGVGNDTAFLLSYQEAGKFLCLRKTSGLMSSISSYTYNDKPTLNWYKLDDNGITTSWLRSPGYQPDRAAVLLDHGNVYPQPATVTYIQYAVDGPVFYSGIRPALWVKAEILDL